MIHHASFAAQDPHHVAAVLAELAGGFPVRAPSPPFPRGSWFTCLGDSHGSLIEVLPAGFVLDPDAPLGMAQRPPSPERHATHLLVGTPHPHAAVLAAAGREGWRAQEVDAGLFSIVKVWVEDRFLVEFIQSDAAARYAAALGGRDAGALDARMRAYEAELGSRLAANVPPEVLQAALGQAPL